MKQYISLENPLCGIGTYKDTLNLDTGATVRAIKKYEFTGNEYWILNAGNFFSSCTDSDSKVFQTPVCSHLKGDTQIYISTGTVRLKVFVSSLPQELQTLDALKQYLTTQYTNGTPVTIWYITTTPTTSTTALPHGLSGIVEGSLTQSGTPTPTSPIYPTANSINSFLDKKYLKYETATDTITTLPKQIIGDGTAITAYTIKGNLSQSGTPTPTNPIYPQETGDKTANLWNEDYTGISSSATYKPIYVGDGEFTLSTTTPKLQGTAVLFLLAGNVASGISTDSNGVWYGQNRTVTAVNGYITLAYRAYTNLNPVDYQSMLNTGSTALPYEPYGYKIPILSGSTTTPVYLGGVQSTRRIKKLVLTGEEINVSQGNAPYYFNLPEYGTYINLTSAWWICSHYQSVPNSATWSNYDSLISFSQIGDTDDNKLIKLRIRDTSCATLSNFKTYLQQQYANGTPVCVWYVLATPTTTTLNEPIRKIGTYSDSISGTGLPTTGAAEQFDVDTTLKPSEVDLTYHGWHEHSDTKFTG